MISPRHTLTRRTALASTLLLMSAPAMAADWPERPIRMIIPFAAGAGADIVGRTFGEELAKALGQPVVIDNKAGAGGMLGTAEGARAPADGYTLLLTSQGATVFSMGLYKSPGYDPLRDFIPVSTTGILTNVMVVSTANPANTVADVIAQARAKPGELTYGSSGVGSSLHMSGVITEQRTGVKLQHVPYRGAPAAVLAVINGEVTMGFFNAPTVVSQIKAGKLKALAVTSAQRSAAIPELPTIAEAASLNGFDASSWFGLLAPASTPADIVNRIQQESLKAMGTPALKDRLLSQGAIPSGMTPDKFAVYIGEETKKWAEVVKVSGAKVD